MMKPFIGLPKLYQRGPDGFPIGADKIMRDAYGQIPSSELFQAEGHWNYEKPETLHGWDWSVTFHRWSALVTFKNGWHGYTWPKLS